MIAATPAGADDQTVWLQTDSATPQAPEVRWRVQRPGVRWSGAAVPPEGEASGKLRWSAAAEDGHGSWLLGNVTAWRLGGRGWDWPLARRRAATAPAPSIGAGTSGVIRRWEGAHGTLHVGAGTRDSGEFAGGAILTHGEWRAAWAARGREHGAAVSWISRAGPRPALEVERDADAVAARVGLGGGGAPVGLLLEARAEVAHRPTWTTALGARHRQFGADVHGSASLVRTGSDADTKWSGGVTGIWRGAGWNVDARSHRVADVVAGVDLPLPGRASAGVEFDLDRRPRQRGLSFTAQGRWRRASVGGRVTARPERPRAGSAWFTWKTGAGIVRARADWTRLGEPRWRLGWSRTFRGRD